MNRTTTLLPLIVSAVALIASAPASAAVAGDEPIVHLTPLPSGAMKKIGYCMPLKIDLSDQRPEGLTKAPENLTKPSYGTITFGANKDGTPSSVIVIVDEPAEGDAKLFVDTNRNGDLTDDPKTEWKAQPENQMYMGSAVIEIATKEHPFPAALGVYRFDPNGPRGRGQNALLYYRDYAYEGTITLGGKEFKSMLVDERCTGDFRGAASAGADGEESDSGVRLLIDVNKTGTFDARGESFDIRQPFNIGGTTYEIADMAASGSQFKVVKSAKSVAEIPTPPDHRVGQKITPFEATTMEDKSVHFPQDYKGKIVMLDFWATWCGPCIKEVPGLVNAYEEFKDQGFAVLGVSLDSEDAVEKINATMEKHKMTWPQIYDGKGWKAAIAQMYVINSIPATFLVDGDSGEILATGNSLRGEQLAETIKTALEKKQGQ